MKEQELSKIAKLLAFEGQYGTSLCDKIESIIQERDLLKKQLRTKKDAIEFIQGEIDDFTVKLAELKAALVAELKAALVESEHDKNSDDDDSGDDFIRRRRGINPVV